MIEFLKHLVALIESNPYQTAGIALAIILIGAFRGVILR
jgi:hypothetical protein